jgi:hypothetical protein
MKINKQELWEHKQKSNGSLDKEQAVFSVSTPEELTRDSIALRRFLVLLPLSFTAVALAMAGVGVYGVMSYKVTRRVSTASGSERLLVKTSLATARGTDPDNC